MTNQLEQRTKLLPGAVKSAEQLAMIQAELEKDALRVSDIATKEVTRKARPPFITSTRCSNRLQGL